MADITNPSAIPAGQKDDLKRLMVQYGPSLNNYPVDGNGDPKDTLTDGEAAQVFEHLTRRYWRMLLKDQAVDDAREDVRQQQLDAKLAALAAHEADPWA